MTGSHLIRINIMKCIMKVEPSTMHLSSLQSILITKYMLTDLKYNRKVILDVNGEA